jgi:hypothetical protein
MFWRILHPLTHFPLQVRQSMHTMVDGKQFLKRGAAKYLALAFALVFLVFQSSTLVHSHAGDLNKHLDCTFCLKIGAGDDLIPVTVVVPDVPRATVAPLAFVASFAAVSTQIPRSRSPPL